MKRKSKRRHAGPPIADFVGYQEDIEGKSYPLFHIHGNHPRKGSAVDGNTIIREGIAVPTLSVFAHSLESWNTHQKRLGASKNMKKKGGKR